MADEITPTAASPPVAAPATIEPTAPASSAGVSVSEPVVAPVVAVPEPAVVEPVAEVPAIEPAEPEAPKPAASLLSTATTLTEPAATEPAAEPVAEEAKPAVTYEPFTLPEGMQADEAAIGRYTEVLGKHGLTQEVGQDLIGLYADEVQRLTTSMAEQQQQAFTETRKEWVSEVRAELGARYDTTLREAAFGRDAVLLNPAFGGSRELFDKFNELVDFTGAGDNITFIRAFAAIGRALAEPRAPTVEARPAPQANGRGRAQSRYPNMPGVNGAG